MKLAIISSALAAVMFAAAPAPASAKSVSVGVTVGNGGAGVTVVAHRHGHGHGHHGHHGHQGHHGHHGHNHRCLGWPAVRHQLNHRYNGLRLIGQTRNRAGHRVFVVHGHRAGHVYRLRYNSCLRRVISVHHVR